MKLAILGSGMMVRDFLSIAAEVPGIRLRSIFGLEAVRGELDALQAQHAIEAVHTDYDACLADPEVDTVYVGLPNRLHFEFALRALQAGKHVICEKPFTVSLAEFDQLRAEAETRGLVLVEAITTQYLANYRAIKQRLPQLGQLKLIESNYSQYSSRFDAFRRGEVLPAFDPKMGGGALMDIGIYNVHLIVGLLGRPQAVACSANIERGIDTSGLLVLDYGTCKAVSVGAKDCRSAPHSNIQGELGSILLQGHPNLCERFTVSLHGQDPEDVDAKVHPHRMVEEFMAFEAMIANNDLAERDARLEHTRAVLEVVTEGLSDAGVTLG